MKGAVIVEIVIPSILRLPGILVANLPRALDALLLLTGPLPLLTLPIIGLPFGAQRAISVLLAIELAIIGDSLTLLPKPLNLAFAAVAGIVLALSALHRAFESNDIALLCALIANPLLPRLPLRIGLPKLRQFDAGIALPGGRLTPLLSAHDTPFGNTIRAHAILLYITTLGALVRPCALLNQLLPLLGLLTFSTFHAAFRDSILLLGLPRNDCRFPVLLALLALNTGGGISALNRGTLALTGIVLLSLSLLLTGLLGLLALLALLLVPLRARFRAIAATIFLGVCECGHRHCAREEKCNN